MLNFGFSTGNFGHLSAEELVAVCGAAGLNRVELWADYQPLASRSLKEFVQLTEVDVVSIHASLALPTDKKGLSPYLDNFDLACYQGSLLQAKYMVVHPMGNDLAQSKYFCQQLIAIAHKHHMDVALENLPHRDLEELHDISGDDAKVGICFDISHSFVNGYDPLTQLRQIKMDKLLGVHVSDGYLGGRDDHLPPGTGSLDWKPFLNYLLENNFAGELIMEVKSPEMDGSLIKDVYDFLQNNLSPRGKEGRG